MVVLIIPFSIKRAGTPLCAQRAVLHTLYNRYFQKLCGYCDYCTTTKENKIFFVFGVQLASYDANTRNPAQDTNQRTARCVYAIPDTTRPAVRRGKQRTAVPASALPHRHRQSPRVLDSRNFATQQERTVSLNRFRRVALVSLTLSRSAPASIRTTAASPWPLSIARCNGVIPALSAVFRRVLGRPSGGFRRSWRRDTEPVVAARWSGV